MPYLSIIIPAYNEEGRLPATLREVCSYLSIHFPDTEVIVVDDGSRDKTVAVAETLALQFPMIRVISFGVNKGKGHAVKMGSLEAMGDLILFMDADNSTPISEITKLLLYSKDHEVVIGSRHLKASDVVIRQPWYRRFLSRSANLVIQLFLVRGVRDTQCGFKLFQREVAQQLFSRQRIDGFGFDIEILVIAQRVLHYKIREVPVSWYNSTDSRVRPIRDAGRTLLELVRIYLTLLFRRY